MSLLHGNIVKGFAGENRNLPAQLLPPNLSPDAENIDYSESTIAKRKGCVRLSANSLALDSITGTDLRTDAAYDYAALIGATFSVGMHVAVGKWVASGYTYVLDIRNGATTTVLLSLHSDDTGVKWKLRIKATNGVDPDAFYEIPLTGYITLGTPHVVTFQVKAASGVLSAGGETVEVACPAGWTHVTGGSRLWMRNRDSIDVAVGELAIGAFNYDDYTGPASAAFAASADTKGLWRFNDSQAATTYADLKGTSVFTSYGTLRRMRSMYDADYMLTTGLYPVDSDTIIICTRWHVYKYTISTDTFVALYSLSGLYPPTSFYRWQFTDIRDSIIMVNGNSNVGPKKVLRDFSGGNVAWDLTPAKPDASATTATAGDGGSPNGVYLYAFQYRNADDGTVGPKSTDTVTVTVSSKKIELAGIPETTDAQVDKVRIYRTKASGSVFYYVTEINNGVNTYSDTAADSALVTEYDPYVGTPPTAPTHCTTHLNRLWLLQNRRLYYSEIATDDNPGAFAAFPAANYIDLEDDAEDGTGLAAQGQTLLVTKLNSMWLVFPGWSVQKLTQGIGCIQGATFGYAPYGIYFLGLNGVYLLPFPLGSASPIDITQDSQRALFEDMDTDYRAHCHGIYDTINRQYRVWFKTSTDYVMLVYTEANKSWAKHTIEISAMALDSYHPVPRVIGGFRGYIVEMNSGYSDALNVDGETATTPFGTITTPYDFGIEDSAATFPTAGGGLANIDLTVVFSDGATETKSILYNDATTLYLGEQWTRTPEAGDVYTLAGYSAYWKSPRHPFAADGDEAIVDRVRIWKRGHGGTDPITSTLKSDDDTAAALVPTPTMAARFTEVRANSRGQEFTLEVSNGTPGQAFEIEAYQYLGSEANPR